MSEQDETKPKIKQALDPFPKPTSTLSSGSAAVSIQQTTETLAAVPSANDTCYTALIVDDNASFQKLLALSLSMHPRIGVIDFADSGESALKKAKTKLYDLIFMDAVMPGMDGYDTCALLRKNPEYKNTPIIMVTGLDSPLDEAKGIIAGSTIYVTKPVQQIAFKELLNRELALLEYKKTIRQAQ